MDMNSILAELKAKFGSSLNLDAVKEKLKGVDTDKLSMQQIIAKIKGDGLIGDLDGDGVKESPMEEIKGKIESLFGK